MVCSAACGLSLARSKAKEQERKEIRKRKADLKPMSHWLDLTQKVFNNYIRLRDKDDPCISCGTYTAPEWCAGHYRSRGAAGHLRFNEDNAHKQCNRRCNQALSGNIIEYRPRLIAKIGLQRVEALERDNGTKSWTREELASIRAHYRQLICAFKEGDGLCR